MEKKKISVITNCFNEEENVEELFSQVKAVFDGLEQYDYEHIFVDNCSTDETVPILKRMAAKHPHLKIIVNSRNFGHIRSGYHALLQGTGDAVVLIVADLQDPPPMIEEFIKKWEEGNKVVAAVKTGSAESFVMSAIRKTYYWMIEKLSDIELIRNFTGFGLYDKKVIEVLREINDPYPYLRGLLCDIGMERAEIEYEQPGRKRGITKNNFYTLYDIAMLGITNHSKVPLRISIMLGFLLSIANITVAFFYFLYKLLFWDHFVVGTAPIVIGLFFFSSVQLFFIGVIGEYLGAIHTQVLKRPLVIEKERVNFD